MSKPLVTAEEMARIDARAIEQMGIPSACLMETAGGQMAERIWERYGKPGLRVAILAGKGNNGGDGFVIARFLANWGADVRVFTLFPAGEVSGEPQVFMEILRKMAVPIRSATDSEGIRQMMAEIAETDLVVDAILGTGFRPPVRGHIADALESLALLDVPIASVDFPSGLDATTGAVEGPHVRADLTLTPGALKRGHFLYPAAEFVGDVECLDIGIPAVCFEGEAVEVRLTEAVDVAGMLPVRRSDAHKGDAGHLLIVAGAAGMAGAALMSAMAALRAGAGRVTLAVPENIAYSVDSGPLEVMAIPLPATAAGTVGEDAFAVILEHVENMNALVVGPGLSTHPRAVELVQLMIQHIEKPMILDADALNALSQDLTILKGTRAELLLTPHPGEMGRLAGVSVKEIQADRVALPLEFAARHQLHIALKGAGTIIGTPGGSAWMNPTGNAAMASAGMGDILAGVVGGLLSQSLSPEEALVAGAYLHGLAGDIAAHQVGGIGLTATDLLPALPLARQRLLEEAAP